MKILKWILGILTAIAGIFAIFAGGQKRTIIKKKIKDNKKKIKQKNKEIEELKTGNEVTKQSIKNKQKVIDEIKKAKEKGQKNKDISADEAADFLKKYAKKKGN